MAAKYESIVHEWFEEVWNQRNTDTITRLFARDGIAHGIKGPNGDGLRGPEEFKQFHATFVKAFPDIQIKVLDIIVQGHKVVGRCEVSGTHTGEGLGFKPTGKRAQFEGMCIIYMKDGQIFEAWNNFDFLRFHQQLGSPPELLAIL
jgi:steroid delta-isomerase-like uncharacterized protein